METIEILQILSQGEDRKNQFKRDFNNTDALAAEIVAFSNVHGGRIFIGVNDEGEVVGLSSADIHRINLMLANAASQIVHPPVNPLTEIVTMDEKRILVVEVAKGMNKPYQDKNGVIWMKVGADKRKATSREELQRLFQDSGMIHADVTPVENMTVSALDLDYFRMFFQRRYGRALEEEHLPLEQIVTNLNLGRNGSLNITGALLFGRNPEMRLPSFIVKAVAFPGMSMTGDDYVDSRDIVGKMADIFHQTIAFLMGNVRHVQGDKGINSVGESEIPRIVLEELVANALVHRNYYISSPVRVFVFSDRVEIISPGHLPNNLTIENIKAGNSNNRNPILASFANHILPYRGIGSGILRALQNYEKIDLIDDREGNLFKCVIWRMT